MSKHKHRITILSIKIFIFCLLIASATDVIYASKRHELLVRILSSDEELLYKVIPSLDTVTEIYKSHETPYNNDDYLEQLDQNISEFKQIYELNRNFKNRETEPLKLGLTLDKIKKTDFILIYNQYLKNKKNECGAAIPLHETGGATDSTMNIEVGMLYPNDDLTKILFFKSTLSPVGFGMLIDMDSMIVTNIFCGDNVEKVAFSNDSKFCIYSIQPHPAYAKSIVKIVDTEKFSSRIFDEYDGLVHDIAISADDSLIAIVYIDYDVGTGPIESMMAKLGHGMSYSTLTLVIYDQSGIEMYSKRLASHVPYGSASLTWINGDK